MKEQTIEVNCPACKMKTVWSESNPSRPFCSERCKLIDLGAWANSEHTIPGEPIDPEDLNHSSEQE